MFKCGDSDHQHARAEVARRCQAGETYPCDWHILEHGEDGPYERACGATAWDTEDGWGCEAGHGGLSMAAAARQGVAYVHDEYEAGLLARHGIVGLSMGEGRPVDPDPNAFLHG